MNTGESGTIIDIKNLKTVEVKPSPQKVRLEIKHNKSRYFQKGTAIKYKVKHVTEK